ncbi:DUF305 domain-containing protein [Pseudochryseolinea flava]|uniref:DUF305 domain-containing protein n=2 Tax=Pseudochryseolinea flava TaxID=2059302 RepID=A0A364Y4L8_9BACT|nr:DUF305 domain-containing protein [Pseudochryseolinea flava]
MEYKKLAVTSSISAVIMYVVMFLNVTSFDHAYFSLTRLYMTILMVAPMTIVMMLIMKGMYKNRKMNFIITLPSLALFVLTLVLLRTQTLVGDEQYMKAMIPHHSSAILTSKNAKIADPEVKKLSQQIITSQQQEIEQMKSILKRMDTAKLNDR